MFIRKHVTAVIIIVVPVFSLAPAGVSAASATQAASSVNPIPPKLTPRYFVENVGQARQGVEFYEQGNG